jgi:hypothetical protein
VVETETTLADRQLGLKPAWALGSVCASCCASPMPAGQWSPKLTIRRHARRLAVCWNAFLQAETTDIERIAMRRLRRSYWKKHPPREEWERALR